MRCQASVVSAIFEAPRPLPQKNVLLQAAQPPPDKTQQRQLHLLCSHGPHLPGLRLAEWQRYYIAVVSIRCCYRTTSSRCCLKISIKALVSMDATAAEAEARTISFSGTRGVRISYLRSRQHRPAVLLRAFHCHPQRHQTSLSKPSHAWWVFANPTYSYSKLLCLIFIPVVGMYPVPASVRHSAVEHGCSSSGRLATRPARPFFVTHDVNFHANLIKRLQAIPP